MKKSAPSAVHWLSAIVMLYLLSAWSVTWLFNYGIIPNYAVVLLRSTIYAPLDWLLTWLANHLNVATGELLRSLF